MNGGGKLKITLRYKRALFEALFDDDVIFVQEEERFLDKFLTPVLEALYER